MLNKALWSLVLLVASASADPNLAISFAAGNKVATDRSSSLAGTPFSVVITNTGSVPITIQKVWFPNGTSTAPTGLADVIIDSDNPTEQHYLLNYCNGKQLAPHATCAIPLRALLPSAVNDNFSETLTVSAITDIPTTPTSNSYALGLGPDYSGLKIYYSIFNVPDNTPIANNQTVGAGINYNTFFTITNVSNIPKTVSYLQSCQWNFSQPSDCSLVKSLDNNCNNVTLAPGESCTHSMHMTSPDAPYFYIFDQFVKTYVYSTDNVIGTPVAAQIAQFCTLPVNYSCQPNPS